MPQSDANFGNGALALDTRKARIFFEAGKNVTKVVVVGASIAYHLTRLGWTDVLLLDREERAVFFGAAELGILGAGHPDLLPR